MRKLRGVYSDALRAASCLGEFIALGQSHTSFSVIGDWSVSLSKETLRVWSRHRAGAKGALSSKCPILLRDGSIVRKVWRKSTR